jgi:Cof subfamily protein (haloacid dehalogenase superfamily)
VIVVTGRMVQSIRRALAPAGIPGPVICYQGAVVADENGNWLLHDPLQLDVARDVIEALAEHGIAPNVYVDDELYVAADTPEARAYANLNRIEFHIVGPLLDWLEEPPTKLVAVGEPAKLDALEPELKKHFGNRAFISKSLPHFLEFAKAGVTKGAGLDFLSAHLGFTKEQTIAFGDGENDIELVEWPAYGIAMENATPRVKAVSRWVCPPAADEGVAQVLEALLDSKA